MTKILISIWSNFSIFFVKNQPSSSSFKFWYKNSLIPLLEIQHSHEESFWFWYWPKVNKIYASVSVLAEMKKAYFGFGQNEKSLSLAPYFETI